MTKRRSSYKVRLDCYNAHVQDDNGHAYLICHVCGGRIWTAKDSWEADHVVRKSVGGSDDPSNVMPAHTKCHRTVKTPRDVRENAKGKRVSDKAHGIRRKRGFSVPDGARYDWSSGRWVRD